MWISARTASTLAVAALLLVVAAVAAPLLPRPNLPRLPEERGVRRAGGLAEALSAIDAPERVRWQRMSPRGVAPEGAARWAGFVGVGPAGTPDPDAVARLRTLLKDARTVADPRAKAARPDWVVRFVRDGHRVDVMLDARADRLIVARDGAAVETFAVAGLHREFAALGGSFVRP